MQRNEAQSVPPPPYYPLNPSTLNYPSSPSTPNYPLSPSTPNYLFSTSTPNYPLSPRDPNNPLSPRAPSIPLSPSVPNYPLSPYAQTSDPVYLNPAFNGENSGVNLETSDVRPTIPHNYQYPHKQFDQNPDAPPPYESISTISRYLPNSVNNSSITYPQRRQAFELAEVSSQTGQMGQARQTEQPAFNNPDTSPQRQQDFQRAKAKEYKDLVLGAYIFIVFMSVILAITFIAAY
ncbi:UNVERIFIED_CONTAM: hypothetical protein RMT77_001826 [Armadillidium vulgare]